MNEFLLQQILDNPPKINHSTGIHSSELETIYLACMYIDPSVANIDIDDNATTDDVYDILRNFLKKNEVEIQYEKSKDKGTLIQFTHSIYFDYKFIELNKLLHLKQSNEIAYYAVIDCITLLSCYATNLLDYHDEIIEHIDDEISEIEPDNGNCEHYYKCKSMMDDHKELVEDYNRACRLGKIKIQRKLKKIITNTGDSKGYSESLISLINIIVTNFESWNQLEQAECEMGECYDEYSINFTLFNCFVLTLDDEYYTEWLDGHFNYHHENGYVKDHFIFMNRNIERLVDIKRSSKLFVEAITRVGDIIKESVEC